ncbi:MAG TPA: hypothetical protein VGQ39_16790 [Pyrinomonadaceae bacterium]|jgi:hypothetical protein|nr:hypothetical protein [Pyrinomonadaceae bacterium]
MLYPKLEQKLQASRSAVNSANRENIVDRCKHYLGLLGEYRSMLYELQEVRGVRLQPARTSLPEGALDRKVIREAIETTTRERNRTQVLLLSFTTVSGYEAVDIFNERKYEGHDDWELRASGVKFRGGENCDLMTIQEAVDLASLLRREDYVAQSSLQLT